MGHPSPPIVEDADQPHLLDLALELLDEALAELARADDHEVAPQPAGAVPPGDRQVQPEPGQGDAGDAEDEREEEGLQSRRRGPRQGRPDAQNRQERQRPAQREAAELIHRRREPPGSIDARQLEGPKRQQRPDQRILD